jgi:hypothetical protein
MDKQLLLTITVSQPWGDSAGDWLQKGSMALRVKAQHRPAQSMLWAAHSYRSICLLGQVDKGKPCRLRSSNKQLPAQSSFGSGPVNLPIGPRQAMQIALNKSSPSACWQAMLVLLFSCL